MRIPRAESTVSQDPFSAYVASPTYVKKPSVVGATGGALGEVLEAKHDFDAVRAEEALNKVREAQLKLKTEASQQLGSNVIPKDGKTFSDSYTSKFDEGTVKIESELSNDYQKTLFRKRAGLLRDDFAASLQAHEARELKTHYDEVDEGTISIEKDAAKQSVGDLKSLAIGQVRIGGALDSLAKRNGWSDERKALERTKALTEFHGGIIGAALDAGNTQYARDWFITHKKDMDPDVQAKVEGLLSKHETVATAGSKADEIWAKLGPKGDLEAVSLDKMMAEVRKESDPEIRKQLEAEIKDRAHVRDYSVKQRQDEAVSGLFRDIEKGASWRSIQLDPRFDTLDGRAQTTIRKHFENERDGTAGDPQGSALVYWKIRDNPDKLKSMTIEEIEAMTPVLGKKYRDALLHLREQLNNPKEAGKVTVDLDLLKTEYRAARNYPASRKLTEADNNALATLEVEIKKIQESSGVNWSMENSQKLVKQLVRPIVVSDGWMNQKTEPLVIAAKGVPQAYVDMLIERVDQMNRARQEGGGRGLPLIPYPTEEQIVKTYYRSKINGTVN